MATYYKIVLTQDNNGYNSLNLDARFYDEAIIISDTEAYIKINSSTDVQDMWIPITETEWLSKHLNINADPLSIAKAQKIQELQQASDAATATFKSSALSYERTYLADEKSMTFLSGEYTFVKSPDYDGSTTDWFTVEDNTFVTHTGAQIVQVFLDGRAWIKEQKTIKLKSLLEQVQSTQTVEEVSSIEW